MCKIADYPNYYAHSEGILRQFHISREMPGYELLKKAIVNYKVNNEIGHDELLKNVAEGMVIPITSLPNEGKDATEMLMKEAIRSADIEGSVYDFAKKMSERI